MPKLTYEDLTTIISRFRSSMYKLETSGDYPEKAKDKRILRKLTDLQWKQRTEQEKKG